MDNNKSSTIIGLVFSEEKRKETVYLKDTCKRRKKNREKRKRIYKASLNTHYIYVHVF